MRKINSTDRSLTYNLSFLSLRCYYRRNCFIHINYLLFAEVQRLDVLVRLVAQQLILPDRFHVSDNVSAAKERMPEQRIKYIVSVTLGKPKFNLSNTSSRRNEYTVLSAP